VFVVALLPSALNLPLPLTYPDSWRMATALPIAVFIAAYGAMTLARSLQTLLGRVGVGVAIVLFALSLWLIAADARQHYNNIALPTFEQGILLFSQSTH
jgi:hypothetical protein